MSRRYVRLFPVVALTMFALLGLNVRPVSAANIALSFNQDGGYDNTANVVNAGPTPLNNQTHGDWRDVYWWSINNGQPRVGSPDFINYGKTLQLVSNSAVDNGNGLYNTLNFTGPSISGGQAYISVYDTNEKAAGHTNFDITAESLTITTDILFVKHNVSAGIIAMYDDTTGSGVTLLAHNRDGNNTDTANVKLIFQNAGVGTDLASVSLPDEAFCTATDGGTGCTLGDHWYRVVLNLAYLGAGIFDLNGDIYNHSTPSNPNSGLGSLITHLDYTGSIATNLLSNPGQIGAVVLGNESISLPDNVGVSFFDAGTAVPEPSSLMLLGTGLVGIARLYRRKRR